MQKMKGNKMSFLKGSLFKKLLCIIIAITIFSAVVPTNVSYGGENPFGEENFVEKMGGALLSPIAALIISIGDILMDIIHAVVLEMDECVMVLTKAKWWETVLRVVLNVLAAVAAIAVIGIFVSKTAAGRLLVKLIGKTAAVILALNIAADASKIAGLYVALDDIQDYIVLPAYIISPESIFRGEISQLDVNFLNPKKDEEIVLGAGGEEKTINFDWNIMQKFLSKRWHWKQEETDKIDSIDMGEGITTKVIKGEYIGLSPQVQWSCWNGEPGNIEAEISNNALFEFAKLNTGIRRTGMKDAYSIWSEDGNVELAESMIEKLGVPEYTISNDYEFVYYSPDGETGDMIWASHQGVLYVYGYYRTTKIEIVNKEKGTSVASYEEEIILRNHREDNSESNYEYTKNIKIVKAEETIRSRSLAANLKPTIAKWYYAIRNFVLVVMMIILLYIGIRIILCSIASEKAKYKNMLMDWVIAICLVFVMHYIMVFAINLVEGITRMFSELGSKHEYVGIIELDEEMMKEIKDNSNYDKIKDMIEENPIIDGKKYEGNYLYWNAQNTTGLARVMASINREEGFRYIGYGILFVVLVLYTIFFLFVYLKRALYLAFFTIIAPFVAMTYPIDKLHDGKAQAFNIWFKEYIFNLMIQPVHLLLYTILISSAFELSSTNLIYSLVALGFMMPAEKFLRKMFGFDKAETPGFLGGAAGAALMMTGLNKVFHRRPSKGVKGGGYLDGEGNLEKEDKIKIKDESKVDPALLFGESSTSNPQQGGVRLNKGSNTKFAGANKNVRLQSAQKKEDNERAKAIQRSEEDASRKARELQRKAASKTTTEPLGKSEKIKRKLKGLGKAGIAYAGRKFKRLGKYVASGQPIRTLAKTVGGLYVGATGAILGATLGIASGDISKVEQYGAALGAGGYALGSRDRKTDRDIQYAYSEYERAQYASEEEYRKHLLEEQRKQIAEDEKKLKELREYLKLRDEKEAKEYIAEYGECIDAGITDMEDLATVIKLVEEKDWERDMAITASKYYAKAGGKPKNMGKRERENIEFQYGNIARANGVPEEEVEEKVKIMLKNIDTYGTIKDDLTRL